jgi:hypothetical protein
MHRDRFSKLARVGILSLAFVAAPLAGVSAGQADAPSTGTGAGGGTTGGRTTTGGGTSARADDHDHRMDWGWVGLLGLAGLLGLTRRRDHDRDRVRTDTGTGRH